ncbi:MAG: FHA domain-containing protein [Culturomica sp.]|jgi:pSer/pThr/pTyr-binding forkhead associated (FHA) protein|nr:FHA domain-containing protein [Culturomica sp.]
MELVKCPFCGQEIESDSFYCDQCGEELKLCPAGHGFKKGKVCSACGTELVEAKNAANDPAAPVSAPSPAPDVKPQSADTAQPPITQPQTTTAGQQPPVASQPSVAAEQPVAPEKTVRAAAPQTEPKSLVSTALNARLELKDGAVIGRRAGDYVHVFGTQGYVSGTHARLQKNGAGNWEIVDLDSSNGTFLNGQKLAAHQPAAFKLGDTIAFYDLKFTVSE